MECPYQSGIGIVRMLAVHEDLPEAVDVAFVQDENVGGGLVRGRLHHAPGIRRAARNAGRQAVRFRIVLRLSRLHQSLGPRLHDHLFAGLQSLGDIPGIASAAHPHSGQIHGAIGEAGRGSRRRRRSLAFALRFRLRRCGVPRRGCGRLGNQERDRTKSHGDHVADNQMPFHSDLLHFTSGGGADMNVSWAPSDFVIVTALAVCVPSLAGVATTTT